MTINVCTINGFTLNGRKCADKFAALVSILHPPVLNPFIGSNPRVLRDTNTLPRPFEIENDERRTFEQPIVSVTVEIFGFAGTDTQDVSAVQTDFVSVTGFSLEDAGAISVNIFDLKIE